MTKIEQWQERGKQYRKLKDKLGVNVFDFVIDFQDEKRNGHVKYDKDMDKIIVVTSYGSGRERIVVRLETAI